MALPWSFESSRSALRGVATGGGGRPQCGLALRQGQAPRSCDLETFLRTVNILKFYQGAATSLPGETARWQLAAGSQALAA